MKNIEDIRKQISAVDSQMSALFEKRMHLAAEVAAYKKANNLPIYDPEREAKVLASVSDAITDDSLKEYATGFYKNLMELSKQYQQSLL